MKKRVFLGVSLLLLPCFLTACLSIIPGEAKRRDLPFTQLREEELPQEVVDYIGKRKKSPFRSVYTDEGKLYIMRGYGKQQYKGCRVYVDALYETDRTVCVHFCLEGPGGNKAKGVRSVGRYPYGVIVTTDLGKTVIFE